MLRFYPLHDAAKFILPDSNVIMALGHIEQTVRSMPRRKVGEPVFAIELHTIRSIGVKVDG
jgi:hypothetical protein